MKGCFVKGQYAMEYTWESTLFDDPSSMLDGFVYRSQDFSLVAALQADIWIVEGRFERHGGHLEIIERGDPQAIKDMYAAQPAVPATEISWDKYDVVICSEPLIDRETVQKHPRTLWCYRELGHCWPAFRRSLQGPEGGYDLFLNHFSSATDLGRVPQALWFPYTVDIDLMRRMVPGEHRPGVFVDSWLIPYTPDMARANAKMQDFEEICELPCRYSTRIANFAQQHRDVANDRVERTREHLENIASCKYYFEVRGRAGLIGQAAIEAGALGSIVIANHGVLYAAKFCHPFCLVDQSATEEGLRAIKIIENNPGLQEEILAYQDERLRKIFWEIPMEKLSRALEMKRD